MHVNSGARDPERSGSGPALTDTRRHPRALTHTNRCPRCRSRLPRSATENRAVRAAKSSRAGYQEQGSGELAAQVTAVLTDLDPHALEDPQPLFLHRHAAYRPRQRARARQRGRRRRTRQADKARRRSRAADAPGAPRAMVRALPGCTASRTSIGRARGRGGGRLPLPNPRSSLAKAPHGAEQYDSAYCQILHPFGRICKGAESDSEAGSEGTRV